MPSTGAIVTSVVAASAVSYLIYFDYKRRSSPEFRRQLRRQEKEYLKTQEAAQSAKLDSLKKQIEKTLKESLAKDPLPTNLNEQEKAFVQEIGRADELSSAGAPDIEVALAFYRALAVYPNPIELLTVYDKSVKAPVLDILRVMVALEPPKILAGAMSGSANTASIDASIE